MACLSRVWRQMASRVEREGERERGLFLIGLCGFSFSSLWFFSFRFFRLGLGSAGRLTQPADGQKLTAFYGPVH